MRFIRHNPEFEIKHWYISPTIKQDFNNGINFHTKGGINCEPYFRDAADKSKSVLIILQWAVMLKGYLEYVANYNCVADYNDMADAEIKIDSLIVKSYATFIEKYAEKETKLPFTQLPPFDKPKSDLLRHKITSYLQKQSLK